MKILRKRFIIAFGILLITTIANSYAQSIAIAENGFKNRGEICFSFSSSNVQQINMISKIISIDKVSGNKVTAYANRKGFDEFLALNIPWQIQPHSTDLATGIVMSDYSSSKDINAWDTYPTYAGYLTMMSQFQTNFPNLCKIDTILASTPGGRKILVAKISKNVNTPADKPQFLYTSSMHGDEITGYVLMLRLIDYLLTNYGTNPRVTNLVDNIEIWINPLANPDGTYFGGNSSVSFATRFNSNWVDLNRNYPDPISGNHPDGKSWQPETQAFMDFATAHHFNMSANFHGGTELANYVWDSKYDLNADDNWWNYVSKEYADSCKKSSSFNGYFTATGDGIYPGVTNGAGWYLVNGGRQDYMNYWHHCREVTLEISSTKLVSAGELPNFWNYNYLSLLNYMQQSLYGFRGIITDSITNLPLRAKVTVVGHDMDSTEVYSALPIGNYHRPIKAGTWSLKFEAPGYCPKIISNLVITDKQSIRNDIKLAPCDVSISNIDSFDEIKIYPNPSLGTISIRVDSPSQITFELIDIAGKTLLLNHYQNLAIVNINLSSFSNGIYWAKVKTNSGVKVHKIILSK
ncbi:MAG: M14 family zinc carboxypeptidase [Bacteroidota bacterium]